MRSGRPEKNVRAFWWAFFTELGNTVEHDDLILQVSYEPIFLLDIIDKCLPYLSGKSVEVKLDQQSVKLFDSPFGKSKFIFPLKYESFFEFLEQKYNVCIDYRVYCYLLRTLPAHFSLENVDEVW